MIRTDAVGPIKKKAVLVGLKTGEMIFGNRFFLIIIKKKKR
jgi:hypothetical protein